MSWRILRGRPCRIRVSEYWERDRLEDWYATFRSKYDPRVEFAQLASFDLHGRGSCILDESTKRSFVGRNITIIHQILHHLLCHVHSSHLSSPTRDQQGVCHDIGRTRLFLFICLNKSIARSMFFNSIQPCMSVL